MKDRGHFSRIGFILAAAGSAIGLGNLWKFPYTVGENGGGIFVFVYILAVIIVALPVLIAEIALGRSTGRNPVGAFLAIKPGTHWKWVGFLGVACGFMILSFYSVVAGHTVGYFVQAVSGRFRGISSAAAVISSAARDLALRKRRFLPPLRSGRNDMCSRCVTSRVSSRGQARPRAGPGGAARAVLEGPRGPRAVGVRGRTCCPPPS